MLNLAVLLDDTARRHPEAPAFVLGDHRLDYAGLDRGARQVAGALRRLGVRPGEKVALTCPNLPWFPIVYYGILRAGAVVVPLDVLFKRREVAYHLSDSEARVYVCFEGTAALPMGVEGKAGFDEAPGCEHFVVIPSRGEADPLGGVPVLQELMAAEPPDLPTAETHPDDTAVILYTSGTTGVPKGAELTHSNMVVNAMVSPAPRTRPRSGRRRDEARPAPRYGTPSKRSSRESTESPPPNRRPGGTGPACSHRRSSPTV